MEEANLDDPEEQRKIETELSELINVETIKIALEQNKSLLINDESPLLESLNKIQKNLSKITEFGEKYQSLYERIRGFQIEMDDMGKEMEDLSLSIENNPEKSLELQKRLDQMMRLQNKHQLDSVEELIAMREDLMQRRDSVVFGEEEIEKLEGKCNAFHKKLLKRAMTISENRQKAVPKLTQKINSQLKSLGMLYAKLHIQLESSPDELTSTGLDKIHFLFASNKGSTPVDLKKVASGGELSRLMLAVQSLIAGKTHLPTVVFDEIDTGISGEIAIKVGKALKKLAKQHQLICITHLPQIACIGDVHFRIFKEVIGQRTFSQIENLEGEDRIIEIGTILSGEPPSKQAKENARDLMEMMNH